MLQFFYIKQNADLITNHSMRLAFYENVSELQDISFVEIQVDETEYGGVQAYDCRNFIFYYSYD